MTARITCQGIRINSLDIPPFILGSGQLLGIHWPLPKGHSIEKRWEMILEKKRGSSGIQIAESIYRAIPFQAKAKVFWKKPKEIALKQDLIDFLNIPESSACNILAKLNIPSKTITNNLTFTERCLVGIEISTFFSNTFLFDTSGLDPLGIKKVYEVVKEKLAQGEAALYVAYPSPIKKIDAVQVEEVDISSDYNVLL